MKTLNVNITNKVAVYSQRGGEIVCGNDDYQIKFTFDAEWSGYSSKTARFSWNGQYQDVTFTGDTVTVPVLFNTSVLMVGVYAGDLSTTTRARIVCVPSVLCGTDTAAPGSGETYYNEAKAAAERAEAAAETAAAEAAQTVVDLAAEKNLGGIAQTPGDSETQVMSQKAVTRGLTDISTIIDSCFHKANIIDLTDTAHDADLANTDTLTVRRYKNELYIKSTKGQAVWIKLNLEAEKRYNLRSFINVIYNEASDTINTRVYRDKTSYAGEFNSDGYLLTAEANTDYYIRIWMGKNSAAEVSLSVADPYDFDYLKDEHLKHGKEHFTYTDNIAADTAAYVADNGDFNSHNWFRCSTTPIRLTPFDTITAVESEHLVVAVYDKFPEIGVDKPTEHYEGITSFTPTKECYAVLSCKIVAAGVPHFVRVMDVFGYVTSGTIATGGGDEPEAGDDEPEVVTEVKVVTQTEVINSVEKRVVNTQIETVSSARNAANFGFLPSNTAADNTTAMQALLDNGGTIYVDVPGIYEINSTLFIGSDTELIFGKQTYIQKASNMLGGVLLNKGALTKEYDENIVVDGLNIITNGNGGSSQHYVQGLRGHIAFYYVKNLVLRNIICKDFPRDAYFCHLSNWENVLCEGWHLVGLKDGIHCSRGNHLTVRRCILQTKDDPIALNSQDYTNGCPELGWIKDVLIEDIVDEQYINADGTNPGGRFILAICGAWDDWKSGNVYRHSDSIVGSNGYVYRLVMGTGLTEYTSTVEPTHEDGDFEYSDGLTWRCVQHDTVYNSGVENLTLRNVKLNCSRSFAVWSYKDDDEFSRSIYPTATPSPNKNFTFDNVVCGKDSLPGGIVWARAPVNIVRYVNCDLGVSNDLLRLDDISYVVSDENKTVKLFMIGNRLFNSSRFIHASAPWNIVVNAIGNIKEDGISVWNAAMNDGTIATITSINNDIAE